MMLTPDEQAQAKQLAENSSAQELALVLVLKAKASADVDIGKLLDHYRERGDALEEAVAVLEMVRAYMRATQFLTLTDAYKMVDRFLDQHRYANRTQREVPEE